MCQRAALEHFADGRAAKLHTRCGMGGCQGRTCGAAARFLFGWDHDSVRPPVFPVRVGALIGAEKTPETPVLCGRVSGPAPAPTE